MIIQINTTEEFSETDRQILQMLLSGAPEKTSEETTSEEPTPAPKRRRRTKAEMEAARAAEAKEEESTDDADAEEDLLGGDDEPEYTTKMAIEKATELLSAGKGVDVKKALGVAGAKRVSDLKDQESLAAFFNSLDG